MVLKSYQTSTLTKNVYTPGQWYIFFYLGKNPEQTAYYNNVERHYSSIYSSILMKDQIHGRVLDFLSVPNYSGKVCKAQLYKIYKKENSSQKKNKYGKLDVKKKQVQINRQSHLESDKKNYGIFKSKNRKDGGKELHRDMWESVQHDVQNTSEFRGSSLRYKLVDNSLKYDFSVGNEASNTPMLSNKEYVHFDDTIRLANQTVDYNYSDDFINCSLDDGNDHDTGFISPELCSSPLQESEEIIFPSQNLSLNLHNSRIVSSSNRRNTSTRVASCSNEEFPFEKSVECGAIDTGILKKRPSCETSDKKRVEFKNVEYFFFKDNSSSLTTPSSNVSQRTELELNQELIPINGVVDEYSASSVSSSRPESQELFSPLALPGGAIRDIVQTQRPLDFGVSFYQRSSSMTSGDEEVLSQTSELTEIFNASIMVDLRLPGAAQTINEECKKIFENWTSQSNLFGKVEGHNALQQRNRGSEGTPVSNNTVVIDGKTILRGKRKVFTMREIEKSTQDSPALGYHKEEMTSETPRDVSGTINTQLMNDEITLKHKPVESLINLNSGSNIVDHKKELNSKSTIDGFDLLLAQSKVSGLPPTPQGTKRLPLKKRSTAISEPSPNGGVSEKQGNDQNPNELIYEKGSSVVEKVGGSIKNISGNVVSSGATTKAVSCNLNDENPIDGKSVEIGLENEIGRGKPVTNDQDDPGRKSKRENSQGSHSGSGKSRKTNINFAWKMSLPHISKMFFNNSCLPSAGLSHDDSLGASYYSDSKSSKPADLKRTSCEGTIKSNVSLADNVLEPDGFSTSPLLADKEEGSDSPNISEMETNEITGSPSSADHPESDVAVTKSSSHNPKPRFEVESVDPDAVTPVKRTVEPSRASRIDVAPLLDAFPQKRANKTHARTCNAEASDVIHSNLNSSASSPSAIAYRWWSYENRTPVRNRYLPEESTPSDDSLQVLPSQTKPYSRKNVSVREPEKLPTLNFSENVSIPSYSGTTRGARSDFGAFEQLTYEFEKPNVFDTNLVSRINVVASNVIMKPTAIEKHLNDHDFLLHEGSDSTET